MIVSKPLSSERILWVPQIEVRPEKTRAFVHRFIVKPFNSFWSNGDIISGCARVSLNILVLTSKIVTKGFSLIGRMSMALLSYTGILELSSWLKDDIKCLRDLWLAIKAFDFLSILHNVNKVFCRIVDTCLIVGNFTACLINLSGRVLLAKKMFQAMRPFGIISFCAYIGNQVIDAIWNRCLVKKIEKQLDDPLQIQSNLIAIRHFALLLHPDWKNTTKLNLANTSKEASRARIWLHQLQYWDSDTFRAELKKLEKVSYDPLKAITEKNAEQLMSGLRKALRQTEKMRVNNFGLSLLGYGAMMVGRVYPDTAKQWGSITFISVLHLGLSFKRQEITFSLAKAIKLPQTN